MNRRRSPPTVATSSSPPGTPATDAVPSGTGRWTPAPRGCSPATEDGSAPFWSPDGKSIGFFAEGKLKTIQLAGGSARVVCDAVQDATGTWIRADVILFAPGPTGAVSEVSVEHGTVRARSPSSIARGASSGMSGPRRCPTVVILSTWRIGRTSSSPRSHRSTERDAVPLGTVQSHVVASAVGSRGVRARRNTPGAAARCRGGSLDRRCDGAGRGPHPTRARSVDGRFSTSPAMLVYLKARRLTNRSELRIFDRAGKTVGTVGEPAEYTAPSLSPDGMRLAVARRDADGPDQGHLGVRSRAWQSFAADARCRRTISPHDGRRMGSG